MKKILALALVLMLALPAAAMAEDVSLRVWVGDNADEAWINGVIENFKAAYPDNNYNIEGGPASWFRVNDEPSWAAFRRWRMRPSIPLPRKASTNLSTASLATWRAGTSAFVTYSTETSRRFWRSWIP